MRALAKASDYEARFGQLSDEEMLLVETLLGDASELILEAISESSATWRTDEDAEVPRAVIYTCVSVVRREFQGGSGVSREQLGEYAISYRTNGPINLELTAHERRVVRRAAGLSSARAVELESPFSGQPVLSDMDFSFPLEEEAGS
jgi:hypothetical protein